ncbi:hypothetical protein [Amycolatopsis echigonensis]|uniref:Uncharacterized protein n=1 Tax=Amycolatopsis echigonensis TaxID=2576905 RepID=A0A2N3WPG0_9PSEU|nr:MULTISPECIES: hypothetical protein [Amycolatopsis]MBB2502012.1 hypothetical protein [Amycolatopsis echigonensis]PKV95757.1 hypothetical protein ATK30_6687 [Amycolatopsis niigatensis]
MSAGTLSGLQQAVPPHALLEAPGRRGQRDGVGELCQEFAAVCRSAVDPLEIAAALEFDGLNDQAVREKYGYADVFELAEEMHRRVPADPVEPPGAEDPWRLGLGRPALHGLIYSLPAMFFPAATGLLRGPGSITVLLVSMLVSWPVSQGLAYLGYARLGRGDAAATKLTLRYGFLGTVAVAALAMAVTGLVVDARLTALAFGFGQGLYMLSATVLMVLGAERLLLLVLTPGFLAGAVFLLMGRPNGFAVPVAWALAVTPLCGLAMSMWVTRGIGKGAGKPFAFADLVAALPSASFGLAAAALIAFPVVPGWGAGRTGINTGALLAALPLSLSMGAAEWTLFWFRRRSWRLLRATGKLRAFGRRARLILLAALGQYLIATAVLIAAVSAIAWAIGPAQPGGSAYPQIAAYLALGGAMFLALLLQTTRLRVVPPAACAVAFALEFAGRDFGLRAQLAATVGLLLFFGAYALAVLGKPSRHT